MLDRDYVRESFAENAKSVFSPLTAVIWLLAIVTAVVSGPFGTLESMGVSTRTVFWVLIVSVSILIGYSARFIATLLVGHEKPVLFDFVAIGFMTVVFAPIVWLIGQGVGTEGGFVMPSITMVFVYVFTMTATVFILRRLIPGIEARHYSFWNDETASAPAEDRTPRLMRRLSPENQGTILRLSAMDHHVEIATTTGVETLRLRFTDAINEMEPVDGVCAHRSHWVTREAIVDVARENAHKIFLILKNGDRVPVSRKYKPELEQAGILKNNG